VLILYTLEIRVQRQLQLRLLLLQLLLDNKINYLYYILDKLLLVELLDTRQLDSYDNTITQFLLKQ
jgi:hypothetical protein